MRARKPHTAHRNPEGGFTLAGLLIILTIVMVFVAYTVPKHWSGIMQREREKQTIYAMQQYARAIREFNKKHGSYPVSIDQLKEAKLPRFIRGIKGEFVDPLTGEVDWLIVPASAANQGGTVNLGGGLGVSRGDNGPGTTGTTGSTGSQGNNPDANGNQGQPAQAGIPIKDYAGGPFIGVRPPKTGESMIEFRGAKSYDQWRYTSIELEQDIQARQIAAATVFR